MKFSAKVIAALSMSLLAGCGEKFLDESPRDQLTTGNFYQNETDAIQATNAVYAELSRGGQYNKALWGIGDIMSDNSNTGGGGGGDGDYAVQLDNFTIPSSNDLITRLWGGCYVGIGRANLVTDRVPGISNMNPAVKQRCLGEAQFLRAKYYFDLVRAYGDVPLLTKAPVGPNDALIPRTPAAQVYAQIEKDLQDAFTNLPDSYSGGDLGRATRWAARGLLAKVYLTENKMTEAAAAAKSVIEDSPHQLWTNYGDNFKVTNENGQESLFEVQYISGRNEFIFDGLGFVGNEFFAPRFQNLVPQGGYGFNVPEPNFVDGYENGDRRRDVTIWKPGDAYPAGSSPSVQPPSLAGSPYGYNCKKWFVGKVNTNIWDSELNFPVLRLAEVYLIAAEATGPTPAGFRYLNIVRRRAFGENFTANPIYPGHPDSLAVRVQPHDLNPNNTSSAAFPDAVLRERRYELAFEDDRWFDLKRTNKLITNAHLISKGIKPFHVLLPVPQSERDANPNLTQNQGY
ncbi:RagB/SusD family nutrient uptake outer membrane protein [Hymenobacter sp. ASUV-10]|uniref:RagB/SusD family nutrient uptake outer membrane protein n=1 Tax=Hymenobacter aranciens TaxID=3063996 RepID=A0ABT9BCT3_9BACT|nr:RagB/SusD family nutrient uptake outer membrane protein [Hymenobacter sp. ASUV-10]MDO7874511.1 RagB/SusD family nutrient uptake outer membrane protein [Hymenobacter sp. ASUV-10]